MPTPRVNITAVDGGLGIPPRTADTLPIAIIGASSAGSANVPQEFGNASTTAVRTGLGFGPLAQYVASAINTPGHGSVIGVPATPTAGTVSAVTGVGTPPTLAVTGSPLDEYDARVRVVRAGSETSALVQVSLDGGVTWGPERGISAAISPAGTGLTLTFPAGAYTLAHSWSFTTTAPTVSDANVGNAIDALFASARRPTWLHVVTSLAGASDAARVTALASLFDAVAAKLSAAEANGRYLGATIEAAGPVARDVAGMATWRAALTSSTMAAKSSVRMGVVAGHGWYRSQLENTRVQRRSYGLSVVQRLTQSTIGEDLARIASGPLRDLTAGPGGVILEHDEEVTPGLDAARFITLRTLEDEGTTNIYVNDPLLFSPVGSDYQRVQHLRVVNEAMRIAKSAYQRYLSDDWEAEPGTGYVLGREADRIDREVLSQLTAALVGEVSAVACRLNREDNLLQNGGVTGAEVRVKPLLYPKTITVTVGLTASL